MTYHYGLLTAFSPLLVALALVGDTPQQGIASVYTIASNGGTVVACPGEKLDETSMVAAHKTLPCGTVVQVLNLANQLVARVRIIDRGPYIAGRIIDLNPASANALKVKGLATVSITKL